MLLNFVFSRIVFVRVFIEFYCFFVIFRASWHQQKNVLCYILFWSSYSDVTMCCVLAVLLTCLGNWPCWCCCLESYTLAGNCSGACPLLTAFWWEDCSLCYRCGCYVLTKWTVDCSVQHYLYTWKFVNVHERFSVKCLFAIMLCPHNQISRDIVKRVGTAWCFNSGWAGEPTFFLRGLC